MREPAAAKCEGGVRHAIARRDGAHGEVASEAALEEIDLGAGADVDEDLERLAQQKVGQLRGEEGEYQGL